MDWANEKYVRLFVRDTVTWKMLPWKSKLLLPAILRKLDRSGVIDLDGHGLAAVAAVTEVPIEFVEEAMPALLAPHGPKRTGVFNMDEHRLTMPNYIPAQETRQSDAQRKRDSREKRASGGDCEGRSVTSSHQASPGVTLTPDLPQTDPKADPSRARSTADAKIRPRTPHDLEHCLRVAIHREQPQAGMWVPGRFSSRDADKLLSDLGDVEKALPEIERKIDLFAKDPDMQPWTMAKFVDKFNAIGLAKLEFGRAPKQESERTSTPIREW